LNLDHENAKWHYLFEFGWKHVDTPAILGRTLYGAVCALVWVQSAVPSIRFSQSS
jgi:hypothetical protein